MFARTPTEVWSKELDLPPQSFNDLPDGELFIFNGTEPPKNLAEQNITGAAGPIPTEFSYSYHWSQQEPLQVDGGSVKILDTNTFPVLLLTVLNSKFVQQTNSGTLDSLGFQHCIGNG